MRRIPISLKTGKPDDLHSGQGCFADRNPVIGGWSSYYTVILLQGTPPPPPAAALASPAGDG
jgi:hypothetical protein